MKIYTNKWIFLSWIILNYYFSPITCLFACFVLAVLLLLFTSVHSYGTNEEQSLKGKIVRLVLWSLSIMKQNYYVNPYSAGSL